MQYAILVLSVHSQSREKGIVECKTRKGIDTSPSFHSVKYHALASCLLPTYSTKKIATVWEKYSALYSY